MSIDLTQILVSFVAIIPVLIEMKKNKDSSDNKHAEQLTISRSTQREIEAINRRLDSLDQKEDAN